MILYLWVPLLIRDLKKVDVIPQRLGFQQQGEDQCELLRQSMWKYLTVERFDEMELHITTTELHQRGVFGVWMHRRG